VGYVVLYVEYYLDGIAGQTCYQETVRVVVRRHYLKVGEDNMDSPVQRISWSFWGRWLLATFLGWVGGIILAIVLSYLIVNIFYPKETNLIVGLVLGAVVGFAQMIAARRIVALTFRWVWGAAVGMGIPLLVAVIIDEIWFSASEASDMMLVLVAVLGGAVAGFLQAPALRRHTPMAQWWVLASVVSWGLAWLISAVIGEAGFMLGGLVFGALSGAFLVWIVNSSSADKGV